jgi:osmoprotectant transport system permease protein
VKAGYFKEVEKIELLSFFVHRWDSILNLTWEHFLLVLVAMTISVIIGIVVGILITFHARTAQVVLNITGVFMTIPSLALFALMIPIFHIGFLPAVIGLVLYTQLPIVRNVYTGIINIDPAIIESARGMGMPPGRIMFKIKLPLAFPVILAGIRTAVIMGVGMGAIAAYIGAGGLGDLIFQGISRTNDKMILTGAIMVSLLTVITDRILSIFQKRTEIEQ